MKSERIQADSSSRYADGPRLLADVGGTNARFALETDTHRFAAVTVYACDAYATFDAAVTAYLASAEVRAVWDRPVRHAAVAIANPVEGDVVKMTNHHWNFSISAVRAQLGLQTLVVVNDFTALAMALPHLGPHQRVKVGGGEGQAGRAIGLIGPGTGLGVSGIIPAGKHWVPLASEGGHVSFAPIDEVEVDILRFFWRDHKHVSAERLISGPGLEGIYRALADRAGAKVPPLTAAEISGAAADGSCALCAQAVERFCGMLGTVAGNLAMTLGATGGMYIGGGIVPRLGTLFTQSCFRERFEAKGRFADYLAQIPSYIIMEEYPAFLGVSAILAEQLATA
jgi:glucokinase